jgi:hypothetical protein
MSVKEWLGVLAVLQGFVNITLYTRTILAGKTRPHAFSWLLWAIIMAVVFVAQYTDKAGPGAWQTGISTVLCAWVGILSIFRGEKNITRSDWVAFLGTLLAIPLWIATKDPLASVIMLTVMDAVGYYPTLRKSWHAPYQENLYRPFRASAMWLTSICAIEHYSVVTVLYPSMMIAMELVLGAMLIARRRA